MTKPLYLMANWKMYVGPKEAGALAKRSLGLAKKMPRGVNLVLFPSALSFSEVKKLIGKSKVAAGAQNVYWVGRGGETGEVSAQMYKEAGAKYALVGHSERRHLFHENNHDVRQKIEAALAVGLIPVLCVGETKNEKQNGDAEEVIEAHLRAAYTEINWPKKTPLIIAYEPVWAISHGAGKNQQGEYCDPKKAEQTHLLIKHFTTALVPGVAPVVLYGGSVRPNTVVDYVAMPNVDGVLVGAASTKPPEWEAIVKNALKV